MAQVNIQYTADISQLNAKLDQIIQKQEQVSSSSKKAGDDMANASKKATSETEKLDFAVRRLTAAIASAFAISRIVEFTKSLIEAERKMELLQNRLNFLAGGADMGEQMFLRLEATSRRLGLSIEDTAEGMASFGIAAKQAGFSAQKSERIFVQVASGLRAAGASSLQTQRAFYALQQMMSKGVVAAEELRRQLGESLPGASDLMTKAYNRLHPAANLTNLEFTKLLETGKIISKDILPAFAAVIEETFAPALAGKKESLDAALNKVNNEILKLKLNIGNADWFKAAANVIGTSLFELNAVLSSESLSTLDKIYASLFVGDPAKSQKTVGAFDMIQKAVEEYNREVAQAITTNKVFGDALEKHSEKYKGLTESERDLYKKKTDDEIEANKEIIKSSKELLKENDKLIEAKKKEFEEAIKIAIQGKTKIQAYAIEQKMLKDLSEEIINITEKRTSEEKQAETAASNAISRNQFLEASLIEFYNLDAGLNDQQKKRKEESDEAEKQRLKDDVYRAQARVELAMKGSQEESAARAELAEKQMNLDVFVAKSEAQAQLARVVGEKESNKQIEDSRRKLADALSEINEQGVDIDPNLIKRLNKEISTLKDIFSDIVIEDEIIPSEDIALNAIDKQLETWAANKSEITMAIAAPYLDALDIEIAETKIKYAELISLTKENSEERRLLEESLQKELENIKEKYTEKDKKRNEQAIREAARMVSRVATEIARISRSFADAERDMMSNNLDASLNMLNAKLQAGLISEEEYNERLNEIRKKQFKIDQDAAIANVKINTGLAIVRAFADLKFPLAIAAGIAMVGIADTQINAIKSQPFPTFHDGGIDVGGDSKKTSGPLKSDEFIAKLQRGESIIDRQDTRKYKDELSAIRDGKFEEYIASKYILPAIERTKDKMQPRSNMTSMEMAFQSAEMVNAIRGNKVIKLHKSSIKELAGQIKPKASDKILARRSFR
jgi:tape measure domain-containing protein